MMKIFTFDGLNLKKLLNKKVSSEKQINGTAMINS